MSIDPGFEVPVEAVLRERVAALRGGPNLNAGGMIDDAPPGRLALSLEALEVLPLSVQSAHDPGPPHVGTRLLSACIRSDEPQILALLRNWLHGYWVVESVELALEQREQLAPGHEFVTLAGHRISRFGVQFHHPDSEQDGLLARQNELTVLDSEWAEAKLRVDEEATRVEVAHQAHHSGQQALVLARDASRAAIRLASQNRQSADSLGQTRTRAVEAKRRIEAELLEAQSEADEQIKLAEAAEVEVAQTQTLRQQQTFDLERGRQATADSQAHLSQVKTALRALEHQDQETAFELREARARAARAEEQRASAAAELQRALEDVETQHQKLATLRADEANESLESARVRRDLAESALGAARAELDALSLVLRQIDGERLLQERGLDPIRARIQQHQLEEQAARLMLEQVLLQITEAQAESGAVVDEMALRARFNPPPAISYLQQEGTRLGRAIAALGSVNLAALDELNEARERTAFLESQSADLHQAMQTLEGAIRSIDRETRELLRETFDRVNGHFGRLFPLLFGGGEARLTLSGDEILDAGLHVTAQPPGKRNTSIQLLSGGEKAMTATALVFALFQLNPAPFCLLDEVDAALDDANTERYCRMVRTMADQTQFLFITHNRIAMEFAEQLIGVTMQERGVSRIVAVDLDTAERMAEAA
jgi:chromosome segregation protein